MLQARIHIFDGKTISLFSDALVKPPRDDMIDRERVPPAHKLVMFGESDFDKPCIAHESPATSIAVGSEMPLFDSDGLISTDR